MTGARGMLEFFKEKTLRRIFLVSVLVAVAFPLVNAVILYPSYTRLIKIHHTEVATNLTRFLSENVLRSSADIDVAGERSSYLMEVKADFGLYKLKVFNMAGTVTFSTDEADIGTANNKPFFKEIISSGRVFTKLVTKNSRTREGLIADTHMVETYVPIMKDGRFIGAVEVYYEVTPGVKEMRFVTAMGTALPLIMTIAFIVIITFLLRKVHSFILATMVAEGELIAYGENLEDEVQVRTAALTEAHEDLEREIAEHTRASRELIKSEGFLNSIFDSINDPFCIFDRNLNIVRANKSFARLKGRGLDTLTGNQCFRVLEGRQAACDDCVVQKTFDSGDPLSKRKQVTLPDGSRGWVEILTYPIFDSKGKVGFVVEYTRDVTRRVMAEEERNKLIKELENLSRTDPLTGLLNRRAVNAQLEMEVARARRYGHGLAVISCDVDSFKNVNDTHGHAAGDKVLTHIAGSICGVLREIDVAGRYGGDEFLVIMAETDLEGAGKAAERIREDVMNSTLMPKVGTVTLSLGVATLADSEMQAGPMLKRADAALYAAKNAGRNRVSISSDSELKDE